MILTCVDVVSVAVAPVGAGAGPQPGAAFWLSSGPFTLNLSTWRSSPGIPSTQRRCDIEIALPVLYHCTIYCYPTEVLKKRVGFFVTTGFCYHYHFSAWCFTALNRYYSASWRCETMAVKYPDDIILHPGVSAGDEYQKTPEQDWKTPRPVPQLPQSSQRQLGPTWVSFWLNVHEIFCMIMGNIG